MKSIIDQFRNDFFDIGKQIRDDSKNHIINKIFKYYSTKVSSNFVMIQSSTYL